MQITVNGETRTLAEAQTIAGLLAAIGLDGRKIAVEVNDEVVPRGRHPIRMLAEGDRVEIIRAIGGG